ncbi:hypothetical protein QR680_012762 [Steinernema hermaphroditum]|uniref:Uncharacterized protein n=1 Tax=Steinernema hermaphroditum TaxID=289476 RepID=A0AA39M126_9BILA|nr:hypothetical protein QR680_012762 [Steinernema hermaphroditum]
MLHSYNVQEEVELVLLLCRPQHTILEKTKTIGHRERKGIGYIAFNVAIFLRNSSFGPLVVTFKRSSISCTGQGFVRERTSDRMDCISCCGTWTRPDDISGYPCSTGKCIPCASGGCQFL